jgi:hypothetical protein
MKNLNVLTGSVVAVIASFNCREILEWILSLLSRLIAKSAALVIRWLGRRRSWRGSKLLRRGWTTCIRHVVTVAQVRDRSIVRWVVVRRRSSVICPGRTREVGRTRGVKSLAVVAESDAGEEQAEH